MRITRRQLLITASAAGVVGAAAAFVANGDEAPMHVWRGPALGREVRVALYGTDAERAAASLTAVAAEIERLEQIFSLHRNSSEISQLNRTGHVASPSPDLVEVLQAALIWRKRTGGAFDPTVQPLLLDAAAARPVTRAAIAKAATEIEVSSNAIRLVPNASVTLNGIAQGRIADRVTEILARHGFGDIVVDAGELRLPGKSRRAVGIPAAKAAVSVAEVAIATSEPKSLVFDQPTFRHHLIDPHTGESPRYWHSISVFAPTAEMADALSTAFAVLPHEAVADMVVSFGDVAIIGSDWKGRIRRFGDLAMLGGSQRG